MENHSPLHRSTAVIRRFTESREGQGEKSELNPQTLDQARLLVNGLITEPDEHGEYSFLFKVHFEECAITFLQDELVMLSPSIAKPSDDIQFIFKKQSPMHVKVSH